MQSARRRDTILVISRINRTKGRTRTARKLSESRPASWSMDDGLSEKGQSNQGNNLHSQTYIEYPERVNHLLESFEANCIHGHYYLSRTSKPTRASHAFFQLFHNLYLRRVYLRGKSAIASSYDIPFRAGSPFRSPIAQYDRPP